MGISQAPKFMEVSYPKKSSNSSISMSVKRIFRKLLHGNAGQYDVGTGTVVVFVSPRQIKAMIIKVDIIKMNTDNLCNLQAGSGGQEHGKIKRWGIPFENLQ